MSKDQFLRKNTAQAYRYMRSILRVETPDPKPKRWWTELDVFILGCCLVCLVLLVKGCDTPAMASTIPDSKAILAIIGEAEGEGYQGMLAVACALRNRGTLKGVYGLTAPRVRLHRYSQVTYELSTRAWQESANYDITHGATHWEGTAFRKPYWSKGMVCTLTVGGQRFYK